jgi:nitrous oxide reductase accessory protein NosL
MGHELIPLETEEDAGEYWADHGGRRILRYGDVTYELLLKLDEGQFE